MDVKLKTGATVAVSEENIFSCPEGLFGFEEYKKYAIVDSEFPPFLWMQSLENEHLAFLIVDPFMICDDYEIDIDDKNLLSIGIESPKDVCIMTIVTIPSNGGPVTANLQGPLIMNRKNNECKQVIINDCKWSTKFNIVESLKKREVVC